MFLSAKEGGGRGTFTTSNDLVIPVGIRLEYPPCSLSLVRFQVGRNQAHSVSFWISQEVLLYKADAHIRHVVEKRCASIIVEDVGLTLQFIYASF